MSYGINDLILFLAAIGFGGSIASIAVTYVVINSILLAAPEAGAPKMNHVKVVAFRLIFFVFAVGGLAIVRPLRMVIEDNPWPPVAGLVVLFALTVLGLKYVAPTFVRIRLVTGGRD